MLEFDISVPLPSTRTIEQIEGEIIVLRDQVARNSIEIGKKLIEAEPRAIGLSMAFMNSWAQNFAETVMGTFRAEMRKRGKEI